MANFTLTQVVNTPNQNIGEPESYSASLVISLVETAVNSAETQFTIAIDVSAVKAIAIVCDVDCTLCTNASIGGAPTNTIVLVANKPYIWKLGDYNTFKLTGDVTSMFVTVAGVVDGTFRVEGVQDATP